MTTKRYQRYRSLRKLMIFAAAAPLFQMAQCAAGLREASADTANTLFALFIQTIVLAPVQFFLGSGLRI